MPITEAKRLYLKKYYLRNRDHIKKQSLKWWKNNKQRCYNRRKLKRKIRRACISLHKFPILVDIIRKAIAHDRRKVWRQLRRDFENIQRLKIAA